MQKCALFLASVLLSCHSWAQPAADWSQQLQSLPKGADLHTHLVGATYAEKLIHYGFNDPACFNKEFYFKPCPSDYTVKALIQDKPAIEKMVDAWSMRNFQGNPEQRHDHFFETFFKFWPYARSYSGPILAEIMQRAADQNVQYLEIMITPDDNASGELAKTIEGPLEFAEFQKKLTQHDFAKILATTRDNINTMEQQARTLLNCSKQADSAACQMPVRYQYIALRGQPAKQVFAQLFLGFQLANVDHRVVAVNLVMPEDGEISMRDYDLHMRMMDYFHKQYPKVHISLHAGELTKTFVKANDLSFHIHHAIDIGHAERIGHGTDMQEEKNATALAAKMAKQGIAVEINLTSNELVLGTTPKTHPIHFYLKHNVPLVLSTDDEGVLRTDITTEYKKAATDYQLSYQQLKQLSRNSLTYAFLEGDSIWLKTAPTTLVNACKQDTPGQAKPSAACQQYLKNSLKARLQWQLEAKFQHFEQVNLRGKTF